MKPDKISLELLRQIQKVEAPPFLFTRIQQKIANTMASRFSPTISWSLGVSLILIIALNLVAVNTSIKQAKWDNNLVNSMDLMPDNSFYK